MPWVIILRTHITIFDLLFWIWYRSQRGALIKYLILLFPSGNNLHYWKSLISPHGMALHCTVLALAYHLTLLPCTWTEVYCHFCCWTRQRVDVDRRGEKRNKKVTKVRRWFSSAASRVMWRMCPPSPRAECWRERLLTFHHRIPRNHLTSDLDTWAGSQESWSGTIY